MRTIKTAIATILIGALSLPAFAGTAEIDFEGTSPYITSRSESEGVRYDVVGQFVNYQIEDGEIRSTQIPHSATGFSVTDAGVTFTLSEEPVERTPTPAQSLVDADEPATTSTRLPEFPVN